MKCLILASGFGTRLRHVTKKTAKGLLPYKGKPVINYILQKIPADMDVYVNANKRFEPQFRQWQKTLARDIHLFIEPVKDEQQNLGAVGSLEYWARENNIDDDVIVVASDNYFEMDMADFIAHFDGRHTLVAIHDVLNKEEACQFGVVKLRDKRVVELVEKPENPRSSLVATACYIFPARMLSILHEYCSRDKKDNLGDFIAYLIRHDEVHACVFEGLWFDIGNVWPQLNENPQEKL